MKPFGFMAEIGRRLSQSRFDFWILGPLVGSAAVSLIHLGYTSTAVAAFVGARLVSLFASVASLVVSALIIKRFVSDRRLAGLALALLAFWPARVMGSVRLEADSAAAPLIAAALYFTIRWFEDDRPRALVWATASSAAGLLLSRGALPVALGLGVLLAHRARSAPRRARLGHRGLVLLVLGLCAALNGWQLGSEPAGTRSTHLRFLGFDGSSFLAQPFADARALEAGAVGLPEFLLKSSLFGTHEGLLDPEIAHSFNASLASGINFLLLSMMGVGLVAWFITKPRRPLLAYRVPLLVSLASVGVLVARAASAPARQVDARLAWPAVITGSLLFVLALEKLRRDRRALASAGMAAALTFVLLAIVFFAPKETVLRKYWYEVVDQHIAAFADPCTPDGGHPTVLLGDAVVERFRLGPHLTLSGFEIVLGADGQYEVEIGSGLGHRSFLLGPSDSHESGFARYRESITPPLVDADSITVRPIQGARRYRICQLRLDTTERGGL